MSPAVAVVASLNVDHIVQAPRIPEPGETLLGFSTSRELGGKGGNQAVAAARLGADVAVLGCVGQDEDGDEYLKALVAEGIDVTHVRRSPLPTGRAAITVDAEGVNSIVVVAGANADIPAPAAETAIGELPGLRVVVGQLEAAADATERAFAAARERGVLTILNTAPAADAAGKLVPFSDVVVANEIEFRQLTGEDPFNDNGLRGGSAELFAAGCRWVIVTLGAKGCAVLDASSSTHVPAVAVQAVDTTAAGDSFVGALAARLAEIPGAPETADVVTACAFAAKVAAVVVTRHGAHPSLPTLAEVLDT
ncbi:ribokinase [Amycolatopsis sp. AA4]|uniref:ribokinase n=1 Tax=Actinomycetes TaxID=1760 RepID=UPI0001B58B89|nr:MULTISPECIES: ribokinase [Actinomycetes]ATY13379.1 ribokinase [Amycolatopsis sp. AA4]